MLLAKDGTKFSIPRPLLLKYPKLPLPLPYALTASLQISRDVGHVLVHYLHTETYQCLRPHGSSVQERLQAELTTSVGVYAAAQEFNIQVLETLAKAEIERLGIEIHLPKVLDIVQNAYTGRYTTDPWLCGYLKSSLQSTLQDPSRFQKLENAGIQDPEPSANEFLFNALTEWMLDHRILPLGLQPVPQDEIFESAVLVMPLPDLPSPNNGLAYAPSDISLNTLSAESHTDHGESPVKLDSGRLGKIEGEIEPDIGSKPPKANSEPTIEPQPLDVNQPVIPCEVEFSCEPEAPCEPDVPCKLTFSSTVANRIDEYQSLLKKKKLNKMEKARLKTLKSGCKGLLDHTQTDEWKTCVVCCSRVRRMAGEIDLLSRNDGFSGSTG